jgi:4-hydroxybenzoate polyprenyltransferase
MSKNIPLQQLNFFLTDIKLSHTIFAFPFVISSLLLHNNLSVSFIQIFLLILCMITARTYAMGINRFLDRNIDAKNIRTQNRAIPSGKLDANWALLIITITALVFIMSSFAFNISTGILSIPLLLILTIYSLTKHISYLCHLYLGFCLALAPIGAHIALFSTAPSFLYLLAVAIMCWVAGFDIIYAIQDTSFDKKEGLHSFPVKFGQQKSLLFSKILFAIMTICLFSIGYLLNKNFFYYIGCSFVAVLLFFEHYLAKKNLEDNNTNQIEAIFFQVNAMVSVVFLFFVFIDWLVY